MSEEQILGLIELGYISESDGNEAILDLNELEAQAEAKTKELIMPARDFGFSKLIV